MARLHRRGLGPAELEPRGLYEVAADDVEERLALLRLLEQSGRTLDELTGIDEPDKLTTLPPG